MDTKNNTEYVFIDLKFKNNTITISDFLSVPKSFKDKLYDDGYYWIYCIYEKNDITERPIYIGKASNIIIRAHRYYNTITKYYDGLKFKRKLLRYMHDVGISNFGVKVLYITDDEDTAVTLELGSIEKFDTIKNGLNVLRSSFKASNRGNGGAHHKRTKSKLFFIINPKSGVGYICTGLKLAGEIIGGLDKDDVKTAAKRGAPRKGFFMYYLNYIDFEQAKEYVSGILDRGTFNRGGKRSENFGTTILDHETTYKNFIKYGDYIKKYLKLGKNPENIHIMYVTQDDSAECGYIMTDPYEFMREYSKYILRIYNGQAKIPIDILSQR